MVERRLIALALVVAGVWVQWGPGFALIVAGVGYAMAGVDLAPRVAAVRAAGGRGWARVRAVAAAVPRQTVSVTLVALAAAASTAAAYMAVGVWAALAAFGALGLVYGTHLGWEK